MKNKKIIFAGFMASILLTGAANAAGQIASKDYVDRIDTAQKTYIDTENSTQNTTITSKANSADVYLKTETYNKTEVDAAITDSATDLTAYSTTTQADAKYATTAQGAKADTALQSADLDAVEKIANKSNDITTDRQSATKYTSVKAIADYVDQKITDSEVDLTPYSTTVQADAKYETIVNVNTDNALQDTRIGDLETDVALKANTADLGDLALKDNVSAADINSDAVTTVKILDANVTKAKLETSVQTSLGKADTALQTADLDAVEKIANKSTDISADKASDVKYTSAKAVATYAVPKPGANCLGAQANCVLAINKGDGSIYWEDVAM